MFSKYGNRVYINCLLTTLVTLVHIRNQKKLIWTYVTNVVQY